MLKNGKSSLPYDRLTMDYLFQSKNVPPKDHYYSHLKDKGIDDETYEDIKKFWSTFHCSNLGEISNIINKTTKINPS